jgi:hypothetical protein
MLEKVFETILNSGENGIYQTELCKAFSLDSRDGSRLVGNLEKQSLILRERTLYKGRWTYKLLIKKSPVAEEFARKPIDIECVEGSPCFSCTYQHLCSSEDETSLYSPARCTLLEEWVVTSFDKVNIEDNNNGNV